MSAASSTSARASPVTVKGRTKPVRAYEVLRPKPRTFRMPTRGDRGCGNADGRSRPGARRAPRLLRRRDARRDACARVAVVGEPGVGKSRLLYEFENWVELLAADGVLPQGTRPRDEAERPVRRVPRSHRIALSRCSTAIIRTTVASKLREGFAPHLATAEADLVGHWLGFDLSRTEAVRRIHGSPGFASACTAHLARFLRSLASEDLVLIVIEDLHWADADSLSLLDDLAERLDDSADADLDRDPADAARGTSRSAVG